MGERPAANRALCPKTCELLERIPDLFQAGNALSMSKKAGRLEPPVYRLKNALSHTTGQKSLMTLPGWNSLPSICDVVAPGTDPGNPGVKAFLI
jgi:hypothetical protein